MMDPLPLEQTDPEMAEHIRLIANREHPLIRRLNIGLSRAAITFHDGRVKVVPNAGRNDPCPCKSGRKFKKCCGA